MVAACGPAAAQEEKAAPKRSTTRPPVARPDGPPPPTGGGSLAIVADGEPTAKAKTIETMIQRGVTSVLRENGSLRPSEEFPASKVHAEKIDRNTYNVLRQFIVEGSITLAPTSKGLSMTPDRADAWSLDLGGPFALTRIQVEYPNGESEEIAPEKNPDRVVDVTVGRYLVRGVTKVAPKGDGTNLVPKRFQVEYTDGAETKKQTIEVVPENTYWQIVVQDFTGEERRLFDILGDPKLPSPLARPRISGRKLVLGSMALIDRYGDISIIGNTVKFVFTRPPGSTPNRVWMKFPLEPDEVEAELKTYRGSDRYELPDKILGEGPSRGTDSVPLAPRPGPSRWYEIPLAKDGLSFERTFTLDKIGAWQARANKPIHYLLVWQADLGLGEKPEAFELVEDPKLGTKWPVKAEEAKDWPIKIKDAGATPDR